MALAENAIPQLVIQEVYIPQGNNNNITQIINQNLTVYVLEIPELEEDIISISQFIQTDDDIGRNNQVFQDTLQTATNFPLFPNNYSVSDSEDNDDENEGEDISNSLNLNFDEFINNDNVLETVQFSNQQIYIEGDNNYVDFYAEQIVYDLSWYDRYGCDLDYDLEENITFDDFLTDFAGDYAFDSVQVGVQDTILFGNNNNIVQQLDQTLANFVFLSEDLIIELQEQSADSPVVQFAFQESFLLNANNNNVEQFINQNIELNFDFRFELDDEFEELTGEQLTNPNFDIDAFILPILENTIENSDLFGNHEVLANQNNLQSVEILGDDNTDTKESSQVFIVRETHDNKSDNNKNNDKKLVSKSSPDDSFNLPKELVRFGNEEPLVDLSNQFEDLNISPSTVPTDNLVKGGKGSGSTVPSSGNKVLGDKGNNGRKIFEEDEDSFFDVSRKDDLLIENHDDIIGGGKGSFYKYGANSDQADLLEGLQNQDTPGTLFPLLLQLCPLLDSESSLLLPTL